MKPVKTYFLAPNFDYAPGGPLCLGRILTNPFDPGTGINTDTPISFPATMPVNRTVKMDWKAETKRQKGVIVGVWLEFLKFVGITFELDVDGDFEEKSVYDIDALETESIEPTKDYIQQTVLDQRVSSHIAESGYRKPIYMITGVKIARGATAYLEKRRVSGIQGRVGTDLLSGGLPVTVGPNMGFRRDRRDLFAFDGGSDFVFAYRLREIYYERNLRIKDKQYTKGALYELRNTQHGSLSRQLRDVSDGQGEMPNLTVGACAEESETITHLGVSTIDVLDEEDGEICRCVAPAR
ncbi:hypothetical protein ONZ43_g2659 [Nemania bipapillata]|uniref:Uncharacterized protein n=1 Tax=Nemania bipapillata TaxID=110536 RepID=A0ACC2J037_9PEZI|nr:hypothetical protein ONZ43_g2659 [Nemania bipapillata]